MDIFSENNFGSKISYEKIETSKYLLKPNLELTSKGTIVRVNYKILCNLSNTKVAHEFKNFLKKIFKITIIIYENIYLYIYI